MKRLKNWDNKNWLSSKKYIDHFHNFLKSKAKINKSTKILDIGCGRANIISYLNNKYKFINKPIGVDIFKNDQIKKNIVLGRWFNNFNSLLKSADKNTFFIKNPNAKKIKQIMLLSDISISAGGQTLYEMARIGLPVVGVATAKNQLHNLNAWKKIGFLEFVDSYSSRNIFKSINKILPHNERRKRSKIGKNNLDGKGAKRVRDFLLNKKSWIFENGNL